VLRQHYEAKWPTIKFDDGPTPTFVYAIVTDRAGPLSDELYFFSLVNLLPHVDTIRAAGFNVGLCKIAIS
jgi:uncharacterized protein (TIGR04141 family)